MKKSRVINIDLDEIEIKEAVKEYLSNRGIEAKTENISIAPFIAINKGIIKEMHPTQCYVENAKEYLD